MKYLYLLLLFCAVTQAQVSYYSFSETNSAYAPVTGTLSTASGINGFQDDIPIGFTFNFSNVDYSTFSISTNGFIRLGYPVLTTGSLSFNNNLKSKQRPLIAPFWDKHNATTGAIYYKVSGISPNRTLEVAWENINLGTGTPGVDNQASFKLLLHETSNSIEFIYNNSLVISSLLTASIGLSDEISILSITPGLPATTSITVSDNLVGSTQNLAGKKYSFTPPAICSGMPTVTSITPNSVLTCIGEMPLPVKAKVTSTGVSNLNFQWESSTDQLTWNEVIGAAGYNSRILSPPMFEGITTYYRLRVTCLTTGETSYSQLTEVSAPAVPLVQVSNIVSTLLNYNTVQLSWKKGSGYRKMVILSDTPDITPPVSGMGMPEILANQVYSGSGQQVVFDGTANKAIISGICSQNYYVRVYEYQRCGVTEFDYYFNTESNTNFIEVVVPESVIELPLSNNFDLFTNKNMHIEYPGWTEAAIVTESGTTPQNYKPAGIVSKWVRSNVLGVSTAAVHMGTALTNEWIITPGFNLSTIGLLKFKAALTDVNTANPDPVGFAGTDDKLEVMISSDECNETWEPIYTFSATNAALTNTLNEFTVNLEDYLGQTVRLAFRASDGPVDNTPVYDIHITDISVELHPELSVEYNNMQQITCYPNPVVDRFTIKSAFTLHNVTVFNTIGQGVVYEKLNDSNITLNLSGLSSGIYLVKAEGEYGIKTFKILKK